ncbi:flagellar motor switch protein FliM [Hyphomicrobium denitrificans 1NES1]|uniref:Flagellar motor switch protein FliM n=1 Tax=Hyphomicrobium denitrificans 1NES1 TaxID=670307 RepID=N0B718_9HYPH|nr:FliM/FliN family flagellar motor switch protein [Hyphomicrobium denitrificans]AGK59414.1 flagellar motor switch protein FliM [Hyphomicrobium denitrificans 1NES1]
MTVDASAKLLAAHKSLERALSAGQNRPDRLPGLQVIFGQLPRVMVEELGNVSSLPVKVRLLDLSASTLGETCNLPPNTYAGVVRAERWRNWLYFISDPKLTALFVESALGCEGIPPDGLAKRRLTKTDANILRVMFRRVARSLTHAFSLLVDVQLDVGNVVDKIEIEPQLSTASPVITARLSVEYFGQSGILTIVIPQVAIEPVRDLLATSPTGEAITGAPSSSRLHNDSTWSKKLSEEIARAFIDLNGVLEERPIALGEVQRFAVGSVVELTSTSLARVRLDADEIPLFWCELGKRDSALTLRIEDDFDQNKETVDEFYGL